MRAFILFLVCVAAPLAAPAVAAEPDWYYLHPDSLLAPGRQAEPIRLPTNKLFYLEQKHGLCPSQRRTDEPESLNVRMLGKWGGGPSWGVTGRDTLVYLSRGSEVVVINFADTANPEILNHIQAKRLAGRPVLQDSLLYLATSGYIEVFNVSDPTNAPRVGRLSVPVADIDVEDSLVYVVGADSFMVWSFADPENPQMLGACRDSGIVVDVENGYGYLCDRWGLYVLDVRDPTDPHRVASWGSDVNAVRVRGHQCYVATGSAGGSSLYVLNVSDPTAPWQEGVLSGISGLDLWLVDTLLFLPGFDVVNVADSSHPTLVAQAPVGGPKRGVWVDDDVAWGFVAADYAGLHLLSLSNIVSPRLDTTALGVGEASDISVAGGLACVAAYRSGMVILDVSDPAGLVEVGRYGAPSNMESVLNSESLAYAAAYGQIPDTIMHAVDITDPANPVMVGAVGGWEPPSAMMVQDSFLYAAEPYRFEVFSVANPRQPVWRGRCNLTTWRGRMAVRDTFAYIAPSIQIINIARPDQPTPVSSTTCSAWDIALRDTLAFIAHSRESLKVYTVADPYAVRQLASVWVPGQARSVAVSDSDVYLGCDDFRVFGAANPLMPELVGQLSTPYFVMSLDADSQYIYAACYLAGVCVLERLQTGIGESPPALPPGDVRPHLMPNPVGRTATLVLGGSDGASDIAVLDVLGRVVRHVGSRNVGAERLTLDFSDLESGVYFLRCGNSRMGELVRFVKP